MENPEVKVLGRPEVVRRVGLSSPTIWRMERRGEFPSRRQIAPGRIGWLSNEVEEWIESREKVVRRDTDREGK